MILNQDHCILSVEMDDGVHDHVVFVSQLNFNLFVSYNRLNIFCLASGCTDPLPEEIENGWKSAESYVMHGDTKYYLLTRYSCHGNAIMADSSARVVDIQCRKGQWERETLPECKLQG